MAAKLLKNAGLTVLDGFGSSGSVYIRVGRIDVQGAAGQVEEEIDLSGAMLLPGFIDITTTVRSGMT